MKNIFAANFCRKILGISLMLILLANTLFTPLCLANTDTKEDSNPMGYGKYTFTESTSLSNDWLFDENSASAWSVSEGKLVCLSDDLSVESKAVLNKKALDNYSATTEVVVSNNGNASLLTRVSADNDSFYQLKIDVEKGLSLLKTTNSNTKELTTISLNDLYLNGLVLIPNTNYTVKVQLYKGNIECYINDILFIDYIDNNPLSAGHTAVSASSGTSFDYLTIDSSKIIKNLKIVNSDKEPINSIQSPIGNIPDLKGLTLKINYADNTEEYIPLDTAEIGELNYTSLGKKSIPVKYKNKSTTLNCEIINRNAVASKLNKEISDLDIDMLSLDDKDHIRSLSATYNELTAYERKTISSENIKKLYAAQEIIELLLYPELKNSEIVFKDEFDSDQSINNYATHVSETFDRNSGCWYTENGNLLQYCNNDSYRSGQFAARAIVKNKNWEIKSVSADVQVIDPNIFLGITACFDNENFYEMLITDKTNVGGGNRIQLYKNSTMLKGIVETDSSKWFKPGVWYNIKMVLDNGHIKCYIDDELKIDVVDDSNESAALTTGSAGVRVTEGWGKFDNFIVRGKEVDIPAAEVKKPALSAGIYEDNFDDEDDSSSPSHWIENNKEDNWQIGSENGNNFYGSKNTEFKTSQSWLHVFEQDVDYSAKIRATQLGSFPVLGLYARVNTDHSYIKGGYDFTRQKWFIKVRLGYDFDETVVYSDKISDFELNKWYNLRLTAVDEKICLYVGNLTTPLITANAGKKVMPGRVGVFTERCNIDIDDVSLKLLSGQGRVEDGVLEYTPTNTTGSHFSFAELPDGRFIFYVYRDINVSTDNGKTMQSTKEFPPEFSTSTMVRISDEKYLYVKNCVDAYLSTDGCKSWKQVGKLPIDSNYRYAQPQDRINLVTLDDGTVRVFHTVGKQINKDGRAVLSETYYTDDCGYTWTRSETLPEEYTNLKHFCETQIIKIKNGPLVQYCSYNSGGCMRYTLSYDDGVTWEGEYAIPQIPCSLGSFSVKEDPYEPGTYYMSTLYNPPYNVGNSRPRHRIALLRSYDGLTWEFLADIDRWGDVSDGARTEIMQNVNMSLGISKDYIFPLFTRSEQYKNDSSGHNVQIQRVYRFEKSKLTPYSVWPQEYTINPKAITYIEAVPTVTKYMLNSEFKPDTTQIKVHYFDNTTELVDLKDTAYTIPDLTSVGDKRITVDYKNFRTTYKISVANEDIFQTVDKAPENTTASSSSAEEKPTQNNVKPIQSLNNSSSKNPEVVKNKPTQVADTVTENRITSNTDDMKAEESTTTFAETVEDDTDNEQYKDTTDSQSKKEKDFPIIPFVACGAIVLAVIIAYVIFKKKK